MSIEYKSECLCWHSFLKDIYKLLLRPESDLSHKKDKSWHLSMRHMAMNKLYKCMVCRTWWMSMMCSSLLALNSLHRQNCRKIEQSHWYHHRSRSRRGHTMFLKVFCVEQSHKKYTLKMKDLSKSSKWHDSCNM